MKGLLIVVVWVIGVLLAADASAGIFFNWGGGGCANGQCGSRQVTVEKTVTVTPAPVAPKCQAAQVPIDNKAPVKPATCQAPDANKASVKTVERQRGWYWGKWRGL